MNPETFSLIYLLKTEIKQKIHQRDTKQLNKHLRHFISLCNSVSIRLLQAGSFTEFSYVLKKSFKADLWLCRYGTQADKLWQGRLITLLIHSYYSFITKKYPYAMKNLYDVHSLIEDINDVGGILNLDLKVSLNFVSFATLWAVQKCIQAKNFLDEAIKALDSSKLLQSDSKLQIHSIEIIFYACVAAYKIKTEGNYRLANMIIKDFYNEKETDPKYNRFLQNFSKNIELDLNNAYKSEFNNKDLIICPDFEKIMLELFVVPFVSDDCPVVNENVYRDQRKPFVHAKVPSISDKGSTKSSSNGRQDPESKIFNVKHFREFKKIIKPIGQRHNRLRVSVYSPVYGVLRPKSSKNSSLQPTYRPKSQQKCK
jgi:hypothetical protein